MHSARSTYLKRALTVALIVGPTLALVSAEVEARRGGGGHECRFRLAAPRRTP